MAEATVRHDLDCELVQEGVIVGAKKVRGRPLVILDCSDDGHGYGEVK